MDKNILKMLSNKSLATFRVKSWIGNYNKNQIAEILKISRWTLYKRLEDDKWNMKEIELINEHFPII